MTEETSMLDLSFDNVVEYEARPEGEYELRLEEVMQGQGDKGKYIRARLQIVGDDFAKEISHVMMLPQDGDDARKKNNRLLAIQRFYDAFGIDYKSGPVNLAQYSNQGLTAWGILRLENNDQYGDQNSVRRWITGA